MTGKLAQIRKPELAHQGLIEFLSDCLERAKKGELMGVLVICKTRGHTWEHTRVNLSYTDAIGLASRTIYKLHRDWDNL